MKPHLVKIQYKDTFFFKATNKKTQHKASLGCLTSPHMEDNSPSKNSRRQWSKPLWIENGQPYLPCAKQTKQTKQTQLRHPGEDAKYHST
jgi:hypothetical protein